MTRNVASTQRKTIGLAVTLAGFLFLASLTLTPTHGVEHTSPSLCLVCGSYGSTDVLLNILLFIPFGIGLRLMGLSMWRVFVVAAITSLAIELLQIAVIVGRDASLGDLVSNSLGGWIGGQLAEHWRVWLLPHARLARRLAHAGTAVWLLVLAGSAWAVHPSLTRRTYWGHWASLSGPGPLFSGEVKAVSVGHAPLPWDPIANSGSLRRRLLDGQPLRATVIPGPPVDGLVPITRITDVRGLEMIMLGQDGRDLVFRMRTRASDLRLRDPAVRIENVFPDSAHAARQESTRPDTLRIAGRYTGRAYRVWADGHGAEVSRELRLGPGLGWTLLLPFSYAPGRVTLLLTALWLGGLLLPVGFWSARATERGPRMPADALAPSDADATPLSLVAWLAAAVVLGLVLVPMVFNEPPVHWSAWLACAAAAGAGWGIGWTSLATERPHAAATRETETADERG